MLDIPQFKQVQFQLLTTIVDMPQQTNLELPFMQPPPLHSLTCMATIANFLKPYLLEVANFPKLLFLTTASFLKLPLLTFPKLG